MGNDLTDTSLCFEDLWLNKIDVLLSGFMSERERERQRGRVRQGKSMETFVFLFPQFDFSAPKEEVSFKMLGETVWRATRMKDSQSRYVFFFNFIIFC